MTPWRRLYLWTHRQAFPVYECEQCVGQEAWQGCYCWYYGAAGPNDLPQVSYWNRFWRLFHKSPFEKSTGEYFD